MASLNLLKEEELSEAIRSYPVIYDKRNRGYKDKNIVNNAWKEFVDSLDFVEDVNQAKI